MSLPVHGPPALLARLDDEVLRSLRAPATMHALIHRGARIVDVVIEDEYTHDVVVDLGDGLFAVYDST